jgi:serine/threonine protein kinase
MDPFARQIEDRGYALERLVHDGKISRVYAVTKDGKRYVWKYPNPITRAEGGLDKFSQESRMMFYPGNFPFGERATMSRQDAKALERAKGIAGIAQHVETVELSVPFSFLFRAKASTGLYLVTAMGEDYGNLKKGNIVGVVREYLEGITLAQGDLIRGVRNQEILRQAVAELHAQGILDLDIAPRNVMITPAGEPVLFDFGTVRFNDEAQLKDEAHHYIWKDNADLEDVLRKYYRP